MRARFAYETRALRWVLLLFLVIELVSLPLFYFAVPEEEAVFFYFFIAFMLLILLIFGISPFLTKHEVHDTYIVLRQGWYYRNRIELSDIRAIKHVADGPWSYGVHFIGGRTVYVNGRTRDLILLELDDVRHHNGKRRRMVRVLFDTVDNAAFLRSIGKSYQGEENLFGGRK